MDTLRQLSLGQESVWFLYRLAPDSAAYNDAGAGRLRPVPNAGALDRALAALVQRHDLLRSRFVERDGTPARVIAETGPRLEVRDVAGLDDSEVHRVARAIATTPFALEDNGPLRVVLLRRETDAVLVIGNHHIATDATSQWLIWRDLFEAYESYVRGREPGWAPLPATYDDYVANERKLLASSRRAELERYWRGVCAGAAAAQLPTDRARPQRPVFAGATVSRRLSPELVGRLRERAAAAAVTPFSFLLGVFQALVYRFSGQDDFLLGCPTTTRRTRRTAELVGYFVNTVVLRGSFNRATTFADAVRAAGRQVLDGTAHVSYPFSMLQQDAGRSHLFRMTFTMVTASRMGSTLDRLAGGSTESLDSGLRVETVDVPRLEGQYDLNVEITQAADSLTLVFRYDTALFDEETIQRLLDSYLRMIRLALDDLSATVARVSLVDEAERAQLIARGIGG